MSSPTGKAREAAIDHGFEEPLDSSPIETPSNWTYRGLHNTGGYVMCRIWKHDTKEIEILYNMISDGVSIIDGKWDEEKREYVGNPNNVVETRKTGGDMDSVSEMEHAQLAREMMRDHN